MGPFKCHITQWRWGVSNSQKKRYESVRFNVICNTSGWVGVKFPRKKRYVMHLNGPPFQNVSNFFCLVDDILEICFPSSKELCYTLSVGKISLTAFVPHERPISVPISSSHTMISLFFPQTLSYFNVTSVLATRVFASHP